MEMSPSQQAGGSSCVEAQQGCGWKGGDPPRAAGQWLWSQEMFLLHVVSGIPSPSNWQGDIGNAGMITAGPHVLCTSSR